MARVVVSTQGHMAFPMSVQVSTDTLTGRFTVSVAINGQPIHSESCGSQTLAENRANFLFHLWQENLNPIFDAGLIAGITQHDKETSSDEK